MAPPTSYHMALSVLVPLPFVIVSTILRFWIRSKRKAWGPDDWAMLINLVSFVHIHDWGLTDMNPAGLDGEHSCHTRYGLEWRWTV